MYTETAHLFWFVEEVEQLEWVFDKGFCTILEQFCGGPESPKSTDGEHTGGKSSFHIGVCVAEVEKTRRGNF